MQSLAALLDRYGESHRHPVNKAIHWVCVPLITWTVIALAWAVHPLLCIVLVLATCAFYVRLSAALAVGMLATLAAMTYVVSLVGASLVPLALGVFVAAWIGQFVGHAVEKRRPSFVEDVKFLLVGPAWLLADLYRRVGIAY